MEHHVQANGAHTTVNRPNKEETKIDKDNCRETRNTQQVKGREETRKEKRHTAE